MYRSLTAFSSKAGLANRSSRLASFFLAYVEYLVVIFTDFSCIALVLVLVFLP